MKIILVVDTPKHVAHLENWRLWLTSQFNSLLEPTALAGTPFALEFTTETPRRDA